MEELYEVRDRLLEILAALSGVLVFGTVGYRVIEGWSFFDSLYMTVITLATVGYGEVHPLSGRGKAFTIALILGGIGVMTWAFSMITAIVVEGQLSTAFRRRRMEKQIAKLTGHYIICGGSHAGGVIAAELKKTGRTFVIIDSDRERLDKIAERLSEHSGQKEFLFIEGDATEDETLQRAGIERSAGVFAVLPKDQDNAFVALSAKGLNQKARVVCAQKELGVREKLFRSGADNVVNPEFIGGMRMASEMIRPATTGFLDAMLRERGSAVRFDEVVVPEGSSYAGRVVGELKTGEAGAPLLVAVQTVDAKYDINPAASRPIRAGEKLVMIGDVGGLARLREQVQG